MTFNRRKFIKYCVWTGLIPSFFYFEKVTNASTLNIDTGLSALQSYIDLLLPEGELPGAITLGADNIVIKKAEQDITYAKAISAGISWLNFIAHKLNKTDFAALPKDSQLKVIALSERSPIATLPNLFYLTIRQDVFLYYYGHPEILKYFKYARPPQPIGFMDFSQPPNNVD